MRLAAIWLAMACGMQVGMERALAQRPLGIDVSSYQHTITWPSVKSAGIAFAWAKATEGSTNWYYDAYFAGNESGAKAAGVLIGAYHFARYDLDQGTAGAAAEAGWFWQKTSPYIKGGGYYLMPMLDLENIPISGTTYNPGHWNYTKTTFSQWANSYCTTLSNYAYAAGVIIKPVIYTSSSFGSSWLDSSTTKWIPWIAAWNGQSPQTGGPSGTSPWSTWNVWQYTDASSVSGISGAVDGDVFNGTSTSLVTTLVIGGSPPGITNQPLGRIVMVGSNVTFTVGATGATPLSYQWRFNGASIPAATVSSFIRYNAQLADAGTYTVTVTNAYGSTNSANAVLTVHGRPVITAQPTNAVAGLGLPAAFSVAVSGSTPLSYQWWFNGGSLPGATTNSLTIANADPTNAGTYSVVVTNLYGTATSSNALLTAMDPYITSQPQSRTVAVGAPAAFSVGAVGTGPLGYSWARNGVALANGGNISGQGSPTLNIASVQVGDVGTYSVTVSNVNGTVVELQRDAAGALPAGDCGAAGQPDRAGGLDGGVERLRARAAADLLPVAARHDQPDGRRRVQRVRHSQPDHLQHPDLGHGALLSSRDKCVWLRSQQQCLGDLVAAPGVGRGHDRLRADTEVWTGNRSARSEQRRRRVRWA